MKVQVTKKAKGELFIRAINKTIKAGAKVNLSKDEYQNAATQVAIRAGLLETVDGSKSEKRKGQEFVNVYKNSLSFKIINRSVSVGSRFFVSEEQVDDSEIQNALDRGYIKMVEETESKPEPQSEVKKSKVSSVDDNLSKPEKSRSAKNKTTKTVKRLNKKDAQSSSEDVKASAAKPTEEVSTGDGPETFSMPEAQAADVPDGMYAHDPTGDGVKIRRVPVPTDLFGDDDTGDIKFVDSTSKAEELSFVDEEQKKERAIRNGITDDIFDNNSDVE